MGGVSKLGTTLIAIMLAGVLGAILLAALKLASSAGACTPFSAAGQPAASREAENSIPGDYLRLYQLAGNRYQIPWVYLAAIGKLETDHGRYSGPGVRSGANFAGAAGPMQIGIGGAAGNMWDRVKTDGNGDGVMSVHDPADAIPAAARVLLETKGYREVGARTAIRRYNGSGPAAEQYADKAMDWAQRYGSGGYTVGGTNNAASAAACLPGNASALVQKIIAFAMAQRGDRYVFGATGPDAWDCSSLIQAAYASVGIKIPRTTFEQWPFGVKIGKGSEQPGDLVFFNSGPGTSADNPGHVGMVIDPAAGTMIVARCATCTPAIGVQSYKTRQDWIGSTRPLARPEFQTLLAGSGGLGAAQGKSTITGNRMTPTMRGVLQELDGRFGPFPTIGCYRRDPGAQDHADGRACDFMEAPVGTMPSAARKAHGDQVAAYAVTNARRLGISYVIWRQHIWNITRAGEGWRPMEDRGSITQNHYDHIHISVR